MDRSRLEAFSDGVFAVAITLLVLNLAVAAFVIIALIAVYYIVERTPASPTATDSPDDGASAD